MSGFLQDRGERRDDGREGAADDEGHGDLHEVAAHDEVLETLEHGSLLRDVPTDDGQVSGLSGQGTRWRHCDPHPTPAQPSP
jgi:hypothetical protein